MPPWIAAPPPPDTPGATARVHLRYEDISQDGRVLLEVMPNALGGAVWAPYLRDDPQAQACFEQGLIPILTRFVLEGTSGPFSVRAPLQAVGRFAVAETPGRRVVVNMWAELSGPIGRTYPPPPPGAGTVTVAGRVFAEHVMTRLFAPADARRVTRADMPGAPRELPRYEPRSFTAMLEEGPFRVDETPVVFGLAHTDSNQHVNSLVYLRLFEEAALRGLSPARPVLVRRLEIAYRKPCFAGDRMRVHVKQVERAEGKLCVVAAIAPEGKLTNEAHAAAWMELE